MRLQNVQKLLACLLSCVLFLCCLQELGTAVGTDAPMTAMAAEQTESAVKAPGEGGPGGGGPAGQKATATPTPTIKATATPTTKATATPTAKPTPTPTIKATATPTTTPTSSITPTTDPTATPTQKPTSSPTATPTQKLTGSPTATPTQKPTGTPTPTPKPTNSPTPTTTPTPTLSPTPKPTPTPPLQAIGSMAFVDASAVNVRTGAGTTKAIMKDSAGNDIQLTSGMLVKILDEAKASNGGLWYKIQFDYGSETGLVGYAFAQYFQTYYYEEDLEFIAYLEEQGFPESYHDGLSLLHSRYPEWVFEAQHTGLSWDDAVEEECALGKNLVWHESRSSWKSTADQAYIWMDSSGKDGGWVKYDGSYWDPASKEIIEYFMDPRNALSEKSIFQFEVQSYVEELHTLTEIQKLLEGTFMSGAVPGENTTYAKVFLEAAKTSGASPYMLIARCIQEMGSQGTSKIISGTVPGYEKLYNYFDIGAYTTAQHDLVTNGLIYAGKTDEATMRPWNTRRRSIIGGSIFIGNQYINVGQDTLYLQKFNVQGDRPYTHQYMSNVEAPTNESTTLYNAHSDLRQPIVFKIPVYHDMPENKCVRPMGDGNPNGYLKSLTVSNYELTPEFEYDVMSYDLVVPASKASVTIKGTPIVSGVKVKGTGEVALEYGSNTVKVVATAGNGKEFTYTLNIFRIETQETIETTYKIDGEYIGGIAPGTTVEQFFENFVVNGAATCYMADASGKKVTTGAIGTGYTVNTGDQQFAIVIRGDVSGDGEIGVLDMVYIRRQLLAISKLSTAQTRAAQLSGKTELGVLDMVYIRRHLLGISEITQ